MSYFVRGSQSNFRQNSASCTAFGTYIIRGSGRSSRSAIMGNSPSNTKSDTNLSRRASDSKRPTRQTSSSISHNMLSPPDAGHRRSRSAQATARSIAEPPPPYTAVSPVIMSAPEGPPEVPSKTFVPSINIASPNSSASRRSPSCA